MTDRIEIEGEMYKGGKSIVVELGLDEEVTGQSKTVKAYFPLSQMKSTESDGFWSCPEWLLKAKVGDAFYRWMSSKGSKGIDHLGGAVMGGYVSGMRIKVDLWDLKKAEKYAISQAN